MIAFFSSIAAQVQASFPNFSWWAIAYMLVCIIFVFVVIASDTTQTYHVAIVGFLAYGLLLTTSTVNSFVYSAVAAQEAVAAGHILLSIVSVGLEILRPWLAI
jgi:SHO1 osmosensor